MKTVTAYKLAGLDGWDFYMGKANSVGKDKDNLWGVNENSADKI